MNDEDFGREMLKPDKTLLDMEGKEEKKEREQREREIEVTVSKFDRHHECVKDIL